MGRFSGVGSNFLGVIVGEKELEELIGLTQRLHVKNRGAEYALDQGLRAEAARQEERERTAGQARLRKSKSLGLSFPYDWSNPNISDQALILNVLERGIFEDICKIAARYGLAKIEKQLKNLPPDIATSSSLVRMMSNIRIGFARNDDSLK